MYQNKLWVYLEHLKSYGANLKFWGFVGEDSKERILLVQERWIGCGC